MSEYLSSFRDGEKIYFLNSKGRELVGANTIRKKTLQARHFIMRNELYIYLGCPPTWKNEMTMKNKYASVVCDARYLSGEKYHLVEVDHTQRWIQNRKKVERYKKLIGTGAFKVIPELIWLTTTEYRKRRLIDLCKGLNFRVYTIEDLR